MDFDTLPPDVQDYLVLHDRKAHDVRYTQQGIDDLRADLDRLTRDLRTLKSPKGLDSFLEELIDDNPELEPQLGEIRDFMVEYMQ